MNGSFDQDEGKFDDLQPLPPWIPWQQRRWVKWVLVLVLTAAAIAGMMLVWSRT